MVYQKTPKVKLSCADSIHTCSADGTFTFHCWFTIFHGYFFRISNISFCSTFYAIHLCHRFDSPPFHHHSNYHLSIFLSSKAKVMINASKIKGNFKPNDTSDENKTSLKVLFKIGDHLSFLLAILSFWERLCHDLRRRFSLRSN